MSIALIAVLVAGLVAGLRASHGRGAMPAGLGASARSKAEVRAATIYPVHAKPFLCAEHAEGELPALGDALGSDCLIVSRPGEHGDAFPRPYQADGRANTDWYGWNAEVLAPFDGVVEQVGVNSVTNTPGTLGRGPASYVVVRRADGVYVALGHVQDIAVHRGDHIRAGQLLAHVGNNGQARMPHTHVGAWQGTEPLQIRFDLRALGALRRRGQD